MNMFVINYLVAIICKLAFVDVQQYVKNLYVNMTNEQKKFLMDAMKCNNVEKCGNNIKIFGDIGKRYIIGGCVVVIVTLCINMCILLVLRVDKRKRRTRYKGAKK